MSVLDWIFPARRDPEGLEMARRVAEDQQERVWQQLAARAGLLSSVPEARGYIRCRSLRILRSGLQYVVDPAADLTPNMRERIIERAVEIVVGRFVGPLVHAAPAMATRQRAA